MGDNALLPASVGVRPMADVLWTRPSQPHDPRWRTNTRKNIRHDLAIAVLSTGPVGFGDQQAGGGEEAAGLGGQQPDAALLARATRQGGVLLKPAFPLLRLDRYFTAAGAGAEVRVAVSGPAGHAVARVDARANSMARLTVASRDVEALWWWNVLATNVDGATPVGRPVQLSELWPPPTMGTRFLVAALDAHSGGGPGGADAAAGPPEDAARCVHGALAASCTVAWDARHPLNVSTARGGTRLSRSFRLLAAAPVLSTGWALLGDLAKVVPVSPQRFVAPGVGEAPHDADLRHGNTGLRFTVLGAPRERVSVTLVAPNQRVVVVQVALGPRATSANVVCDQRGDDTDDVCHVQQIVG